jgi:predicted pyridoxine 5'-phosphate oxidase superfamily flavin-nucleotide-binding protein
MGQVYNAINERIQAWIAEQEMFFIATAPLSGDGSVNLSPKGRDTLRVLDEHTLAFMDTGGSGIETIAHLRENGRIVVMMCAFQDPPVIHRFHGRGSVILPDDEDFDSLAALFDRSELGVRAIIRIDVTRVSDACGFGVPLYDFQAQRDQMANDLKSVGRDRFVEQFTEMWATSIDGLPGLTAEESMTFAGPG